MTNRSQNVEHLEFDLRDTARGLSWLFQIFAQRKYDPPPPKEARIMAPPQGPSDPLSVPALSGEDCLVEERQDEKIPGGLRAMVVDASQHIDVPLKLPQGEVGRKLTGAELCSFVAWNAQAIAENFPVATDLAELMEAQARWLSKIVNPEQPADVAKKLEQYKQADVILQHLHNHGYVYNRDSLRKLAERSNGTITTEQWKGRTTYRYTEVLNYLTRNGKDGEP